MATRKSTRTRRAPKRLEDETFLPGANNGHCAGRDMDFGRDIDYLSVSFRENKHGMGKHSTRFGTGFYNNFDGRVAERRRRQEWSETMALPEAESSEEEWQSDAESDLEDDWEAVQYAEDQKADEHARERTQSEEEFSANWNTKSIVLESIPTAAAKMSAKIAISNARNATLLALPDAAAAMERKIKKKSRSISWGDVTIYWKDGDVDGGSTKEHDGITSANDTFATFLMRILAQTGEPGQGFLKEKWSSSWSPQVAWSAVPDQHKKEVARLLIDFFERFSATRSGSITKLVDVGIGAACDMKTVPRKKVQILPGGGCGIALCAQDSDHWLWVEKIKQSVTGQALLRNFAHVH
jgi:hypothetical protein